MPALARLKYFQRPSARPNSRRQLRKQRAQASRRLLFEHLEYRRVFSAQTLVLGTVTADLKIDIYDTDFDVTIGAGPTNQYQLSDYNGVTATSSSTTTAFTANDYSSNYASAGISWGRIVVHAAGLTITASSYDHETFNGNTSFPARDGVTYFETGMDDTFSATLSAGGTSLDTTMQDTAGSVYNNTATDILTVTANGGTGNDKAQFTDNYGNATLVSAPAGLWSTLTSAAAPSLLATTNGFVHINATSDVDNNTDSANLYDTAGGNDTFTATGATKTVDNRALLVGPGSGPSVASYGVNGFRTVNAYSVDGDGDNAVLTDSTGNDVYVGTPAYSYIEEPGVYQDYVEFLGTVTAISAGGGHDSATYETSGAWYDYNSSAHTLNVIGCDMSASGFATYGTNFIANHAPTLNASALSVSPSMTENENPSSNAGELVQTLTSGLIEDDDGFNLLGIAVTSIDDDNGGTWQYNGGPSGWEDIEDDGSGNPSTISPTNARLIPADGYSKIRFLPNTGFAGSPSITFVAWDRTSGITDTTNATSSGTFSQTSATATLAITSPVGISSAGSPPTYTEGGPSVALFPSVTVNDSGATTLNSATLTITGNYQPGDALSYNSEFGITGTLSGDQLVLSSSGPLSFSDYETVIGSVAFSTTADGGPASRQVSLFVFDGAYNSPVVTQTVSITPNVPPTVTMPTNMPAIAQNQPLTFSTANGNAITVADDDADGGAEQLTLTATDGTLTLATITGLTFTTGTGTANASMVFTGTLADLNAALAGMVFTPSTNFNGSTASVSVGINDQGNTGSGGPQTAAGTINIPVALDQAPVLTPTTNTVTFTEAGSPVLIDSGITVSDPDNITLASAKVTIGGFVLGEDFLSYTDMSDITASQSGAVLTFTAVGGAAPIIDFVTELQSVKYKDISDTPNISPRTLSIIVNDGNLNSATPATYTVNFVSPVSVSSSGPAPTFINNAPAVAVFSNVTIADSDNTPISSATISVVGNFNYGDTLLYLNEIDGITAENDYQTLVLSSSTPLPVADYEAAIESVLFNVYLPTLLTNLDLRTVQLTVNDGTFNSAAVTQQVTVLPDPLVVNTSPNPLTYVVSSGAMPIDRNLTLSAPSGDVILGAAVEIGNGDPLDEDSLGLSSSAISTLAAVGILVDSTGSNGQLGLDTAPGYSPTLADYTSALENVTYTDSNPTPNTATRTIRFQIEDEDYRSLDATRDIQITTTLPPSVTLPTGTQAVAQNQGLTFSLVNDNAIAVVDANAAASGTNEQVTLTANDGTLTLESTTGLDFTAGTGTADASMVFTGTLDSVNAALANMVFTPATNFIGSTANVTIGVEDEGDGESGSGMIGIIVAQPPVVTTTTNTESFTAGGSPVLIDSGITITDPQTTLQSATVTISGGPASGEDVLDYTRYSDITGSQSGNVLNFSTQPGGAPLADFISELESLTYADSNSDPDTAPRTVSIVVNDGQLNSNTATYTIDVSNPPTIFVPDAQSVDAGGSLAFSWGDGNAISVIDTASGSGTDSMTLAVSNGTLSLASITGLTFAAGTGTGDTSMTFSGTLAAIDAALDGLSYTPGTGFNGDTLTLALADSGESGGPTGNATISIGLAAPSQSLAVTASNSSLYYNASPGAVAIDSGINVADNSDITGATISISTGYVPGEDFLLFTNQDPISGALSTSGGVLTLTLSGTATAEQYQSALRSITYENLNSTPTSGSRAISLAVTDGASDSASADYTINVLPANNSLAILAPGTQTVADGDLLMLSWLGGNAISMTDPNIDGGTDSMKLSVSDGNALYLGTSAGLATSSGNGTASITISGTLAALDAALDGLEYFPGAEFTGSDTLNLSITDSAAPADEQTVTNYVTLTVTPAVPEPTFSIGPDQAVPTGVAMQTIPGWASDMNAGLPDNGAGTLSFIILSNDNPSLFTALSIDAAGDLKYTPASGASGTADISVELQATSSAGQTGTSDPSTFTITLGSSGEPQLVAPSSEFMPAGGVLVLGSSSTGGIYVGGDTDTSAEVTFTVGTNWGTLTYTDSAGNVDSGVTTATLSGPIATVNAELATLVLEPGSGSSAGAALSVLLTSSSTGSQGGTVDISDSIPLTIVDSDASSPDISVSIPAGQGAPEGQWYMFSSDTANPIVINADPTANAVVTITTSNAYLSIGSSDDSGDSFVTLTGTVADINAELDGLGFSPLVYGTAQLTVTAMLLDASGNPASAPTSASSSFEVRQAPYFSAYQPLWLQDQPQWNVAFYGTDNEYYGAGASAPTTGTGGWQLFSAIDNFDQDGTFGIAITGLDTQDGTWQFSSDTGESSDWQPIGAVSDTHALLLDAYSSLRFLPNTGYFGDINDAVTFRLWDETTGTNASYADASDNGGITAFSADTATAALRVDPLVSISASGGQFTASTTGNVPWDLVVSGDAEDEDYVTAQEVGPWNDPFTVTIAAGQKSAVVNVSGIIAANGIYINSDDSYLFAVELTNPGGTDSLGDRTPVGYGYVVDPSASSASITETGNWNRAPGYYAWLNSYPVQNGDTMQIPITNTGSTDLNWSTADSTAIAGTDYESNHGTIPAGTTQTVTVQLDDVDEMGDREFNIVTTGGGADGATEYFRIPIQEVGLQLVADSNNDGRDDAEADAAANAAALSSGTGGVFVAPVAGGSTGQSSSQLVAEDELVEVDLDFNAVAGMNITLSATGATQDFQVYADSAETTPINVAGSGTTWLSSLAPTAVWIASTIANQMVVVASVKFADGGAVAPPQQIPVESRFIRLTGAENDNGPGVPTGPNKEVDVYSAAQTAEDLATDRQYFELAERGDTLPQVSSLNDLTSRLSSYNNGSISVLAVAGHSAGNYGVDLGGVDLTNVDASFGYPGISASTAALQALKNKLAPNATVVLYACTCGVTKTQLQNLANLLGHPVYACTGDVWLNTSTVAGIGFNPRVNFSHGGQWLEFVPGGKSTNPIKVIPSTNPQLFGTELAAPASYWSALWPFAEGLNQSALTH
jgi:hypothetical protein